MGFSDELGNRMKEAFYECLCLKGTDRNYVNQYIFVGE